MNTFNIVEFYSGKSSIPNYMLSISDILSLNYFSILHTDITKYLFPVDIAEQDLNQILNSTTCLKNYIKVITNYLSVYGYQYKINIINKISNSNNNANSQYKSGNVNIVQKTSKQKKEFYDNQIYGKNFAHTSIPTILFNNFKINYFENIDAFTSIIAHTNYLNLDSISTITQKLFIKLLDLLEKTIISNPINLSPNTLNKMNSQNIKVKIGQVKNMITQLQNKSFEIKNTLSPENKYRFFRNYKKMLLWSASIVMFIGLVDVVSYQMYDESFINWGIEKLLNVYAELPTSTVANYATRAQATLIQAVGSIFTVFSSFKNAILAQTENAASANQYPEFEDEQPLDQSSGQYLNSTENIIIALARNGLEKGFSQASSIISNLDVENRVALYVPSPLGTLGSLPQSPFSPTNILTQIGTFVPSGPPISVPQLYQLGQPPTNY
jgi:hypothetical protein